MVSMASHRAVWRGKARTLSFWFVAVLVAASIGLLYTADAAYAVTFTVNRTDDGSDANINNAACDVSASVSGSQCTFRAAIEEADNTLGVDIIRFNIPDNPNIGGLEVKTISPRSALPTISEAVTITGYTQPGASPNTLAAGNNAVLKIQLNGANAGAGTNGLEIEASDSTVKGLVINRFRGTGIESRGANNKVQGNFIGTNASGSAALSNLSGVLIHAAPNNSVGGTESGARNIISGNESNGISISGSGATGNKVEGNFIGTNVDGNADLGNDSNGVFISEAPNNTIGGTTTGARNIISGNGEDGVEIFGVGSPNNNILGNRIGTNANGTADLGNGQDGVSIIAARDNTVGGTATGARNVISGNEANGVNISESGATDNKILGNFIGTNASGSAALGNGQDGVSVISGTGNSILSNRISANGGLGIDLQGGNENTFGVTSNDTDDLDVGANSLQNFPVITSATRNNVTRVTTISGTINSRPSQEFTVQCFVADGDPSSHGEGPTFVDEDTTVTTNFNGNGSFSCTSLIAAAGDVVSATATRIDTSTNPVTSIDTSEFSENVIVSSAA